uniref:Uncharacterized protein n=1 Tax=Ixodes ricinus TaxID=34613 RepID=A0A0K8R3F7_IXORI
MLPPCHSYALTRRRFLTVEKSLCFRCNTDFTLQCKTFVVVHMLNDENDLFSSAMLPDQSAFYSSLESRIKFSSYKYTFIFMSWRTCVHASPGRRLRAQCSECPRCASEFGADTDSVAAELSQEKDDSSCWSKKLRSTVVFVISVF